MTRPRKTPEKTKQNAASAATVGYEAQLWQMADVLWGSMDAAEYKHVVLGLIFLKYISDSFEEQHAKLESERAQGADPPFNVSDWGGERLRDDKRLQYGVPPAGNANFAWVQHIVDHLAPPGLAGFVLAKGSMSSSHSGEGEIRMQLVEKDLVDCTVALPGQLFYSTQDSACLWFLARDKKSPLARVRERGWG